MEYKSILERNCEDAFRHLKEAERMGGEERIANAYQSLKYYVDAARNTSPDIFKKFSQYL